MRILTAAQMREADRLTTERHSVPSLQLMANAGAGVVCFLQKEIQDLAKQRIAIFCGKGNNGGDGFVVARLLKQLGANPYLLLFGSPESVTGDARMNLERWKMAGGGIVGIKDLEQWDTFKGGMEKFTVIVDALLGTGLKGPVEGVIAVCHSRRKWNVEGVWPPSANPGSGYAFRFAVGWHRCRGTGNPRRLDGHVYSAEDWPVVVARLRVGRQAFCAWNRYAARGRRKHGGQLA